MSKKRKQPTEWQKDYGVGWKSAYAEFRYGPKRSLKVAPIFKERDRKSLVDGVMDVLRDWRLTPFENEAAVRAGLRSAFCLRGHGWPSADLEAFMIVEGGLRRMGAERPSWEQGQREYTIPAENCAWCSGPRDPAMRGRFCSVECGKAFLTDRQANEIRRDTAIFRNASRVLRQSAKDRRKCVNCGRSFMHDGDKDPRKYCSQSCYIEHLRSGEITYACTCRFCGDAFRSKQNGAYYCSNACQLNESRLRRGSNVPKNLTRPIFDYLITQVVNGSRRPHLTPLQLDWMLLEQGLRITEERRAA